MPDGTTVADAYLDFPSQEDDVSYGVGAEQQLDDERNARGRQLVGAKSSSPTGENAAVDDQLAGDRLQRRRLAVGHAFGGLRPQFGRR